MTSLEAWFALHAWVIYIMFVCNSWMWQRKIHLNLLLRDAFLLPSINFSPLPFLANKIYFWYSTIFLICRTSAMFLASASINDESIKPLAVFRTIPSEGWTHDVQRFCNQIQNDGVALSGKNFFFLTRGIIISIAGTIM